MKYMFGLMELSIAAGNEVQQHSMGGVGYADRQDGDSHLVRVFQRRQGASFKHRRSRITG